MTTGDRKPSTPLSREPACGAGIELAQRVYGLEASDRRQWEAIEKIQNRLPSWATLLISVLTFFLGIAVTIATKGGGV